MPSSPIPTETIKIVKPITTQNVSSRDELTISGQSSDNNLKNCSVSVIVNNVKPYQNAVAKGASGPTDFSEWEFVLHNNYTQIIEGENKITSKLLCASAFPRWYSVFVNGVPNSSNEDVFSPVQSEEQQNISTTNLSETNEIDGIQSEEQQNIPTTNLSETNEIDGIQSEEQQNIPTTNLSETNEIDGNNVLLVSIIPLKNPVERGDTQNATITVTDSGSRAVANAEIDGKLIYPGDNYEKDFSGITDSQGKFVYSWIIGEKGDVGALSIEVEVSSQGYPPSSGTGSFDIVDNS
ncbi:MAG TPA: hypothetical protein VFH19_03125 [Nitrososphaeraceae archaeon]|nr:hypothetical protein [Nitrososphaeraceae archaeon]